jgi:pilus assembly protein CpaE
MPTVDLSPPADILVAGSNAAAVGTLVASLRDQPAWRAKSLVTATPRALIDALSAAADGASRIVALIVVCDDQHLADLDALAAMDAAQRPPVIVCGTLKSAEANRAALRAGAIDLLPAAPPLAELLLALRHATQQNGGRARAAERGRLVTVIGAAGGVGTTFVACNLAHLSAAVGHRRTLLVDLDLVYAPLATALGVKPERGILEALQQLATLDTTALEGYITRHPSGLGLLASPEGSFTTQPIDGDSFRTLLRLMRQGHEQVFVEGSRWLDAATTVAIAESDHIVVVLEQSVAQVHNAARLYRLLTQQMGVPPARIVVVLNRYTRRATVQADMAAKAIGCESAMVIPNMYGLALDSMDAAIPLFDLDRGSAVARMLLELGQRLGDYPPAEPEGLLRKALGVLSRRQA